MHEFGTLPDELPDSEFSREALSELQRIVTKTGRLLTIAAVSLAAEQGQSVGQPVQVDRDDVLEAAKFLFVPQGQNRIAWLNDFVDLVRLRNRTVGPTQDAHPIGIAFYADEFVRLGSLTRSEDFRISDELHGILRQRGRRATANLTANSATRLCDDHRAAGD